MKRLKKTLCAVLSAALLAGLVPVPGVGADPLPAETVKFATMSDLHFYPQSMTGGGCDAWMKYCRSDCKQYEESEAIIDTALDTLRARARTEGVQYLLLPGDLTRYSEKQAHVELAEKLRRFEADTGVPVIVTDGNHDINCDKAVTFENGYKEAAPAITPQEFYDVYADLGYDLADSFYAIEDGEVPAVQNALSYTVQLGDRTQLIVVDSCKYSFEGAAKDQTDGMISDDCMAWILERADAAAAQGKESLLMIHHSMAAHMKCEPSVTVAFVLDDYLQRAETLADHNVHYALTGHLHIPDTAQVVNDNGETLTDVQTCALTSFPNQYRENVLTVTADGASSMTSDEVDFDAAAPFVYKGKTYAKGGFVKEGFGLCFGGPLDDNDGVASLTGFVKGLYDNYAAGILKEIAASGGLLAYLKTLNIDLRAIIGGFLSPYIGDGVKVGGKTVLSVDNIMWFLEDLAGQIDDLIADPDALWQALEPAIRKLANLKMSDRPVDPAVKAAIGVGGDRAYGTLEDLVFSVVYYWTTGNEPAYGTDALIASAVERLREPITDTTGFSLSAQLIDIIYNDIVNGVLLSKLHIRLNTLFGATNVGKAFGEQINGFVTRFLHGDTSYLNLIDTFFSLGALDDASLYDLLDRVLLQKYWNVARDEALNATVADFLLDFSTDDQPQPAGDYGRTYTNAPQVPEATRENFRIPTMITVTPGETPDAANVSWYTKYSIAESDVEIGGATFTGAVETAEETVLRHYPGIDLGFAGFLGLTFPMVRHTAHITGLAPGETCTFRVGSAARGWWSDEGTIEAPDGSRDVTFIHVSDQQCNNEAQYAESWANTLTQAFRLYPDAKFVADTGNATPAGMHVHQWQWMLDTARDTLTQTRLLPAAGKTEAKDENTLENHFVLPHVSDAARESGPCYAFDYNNVHIAVLNTNDRGGDGTLSAAQISWLKADLGASDAQWKVVMMSAAAYADSTNYSDKKTQALRKQLSSLLPRLGADLALQGNDCVYTRTAPLANNRRTLGKVTYLRDAETGDAYKTFVQPKGTVWAAAGSAGVERGAAVPAGTSDLNYPRADRAENPETPTFSAIRVRDGVLYFDAYTADGETVRKIDSFAIQKDTAQGDELPITEWPVPVWNGGVPGSGITKVLNFIRKFFTVINNILKVFTFGTATPDCKLPAFALPDFSASDPVC